MRSGVTIVTAVAAAIAIMSSGAAPVAARVPVNLSGTWELNRDLSSPPGGMPGEAGGERGGRRGPGGGGGRGPGGGGFGGGMGGARGGGRGGRAPQGGERPSRDDLEAGRALLQEVMDLPARFTLISDGEKLIVTEPDGVVRTYVANGKAEKHQLTNGTVDTRTAWDGPSLVMQIAVGERAKLTRTFTLREDPRRLEIATAFERAPKDARRLHVYDEAPAQP